MCEGINSVFKYNILNNLNLENSLGSEQFGSMVVTAVQTSPFPVARRLPTRSLEEVVHVVQVPPNMVSRSAGIPELGHQEVFGVIKRASLHGEALPGGSSHTGLSQVL